MQGKTIRGVQGIAKISKLERKKVALEKELAELSNVLKSLKKVFK